MAPYQPSGSSKFTSTAKELPFGYTSIDNILAEIVPVGRSVSVMGLVKDYQVPIPTNGSHHKCTITIYDKSIEYEQVDLAISVFRQLDDMPRPMAGDVLVITSAKVQSYRENISLIANKSASFHIYSASDIPRPPHSAKDALRSSHGTRQLGEKEHEYVSCLYHFINKESIPDVATFQKKVDQSGHRKDKFCKLDNIVDGNYYDVIVNVVKAPFDEMDKTTLWVSDYTENDSFHKFSWDGVKQDSHGSLDTGIHTTTKWTGPFGKRSMQVTCFEPHASHVKSEVQLDQWIRIRNIKIKFGKNALNLEGALHETRGFSRQQVDVLKLDGKDCDPRLKEAVRRKLEYEKLKRKQLKSFAENESEKDTGAKRKAGDSEELKMNSKKRQGPSKMRRNQTREAARMKVEEQDKHAEERLGLNEFIKCESEGQPVTPVPSIAEPVLYKTTVEGEEVTLTLPFVCAKYRTNVRVVDFHPRELESFATWRKSTESDVLSDYSSDSDSGSDGDDSSLVRSSGNKIWEWRFTLQLEDADPNLKGEKDRFWVVVDNIEAQQLTGLDASDLRGDPDALHVLREQLFKLWGNLEEMKLQEQQRHIANRRRVAAKQPPPSSPANVDNEHLQETSGKRNKNQNGLKLSNKPFSCCIRQYGVKLREPDPHKANAGEGRRWVRVFGLFGTRICNERSHSFPPESVLG
ncbi:hypothetical protein E0Z10_g2748 [Xylaria hypoxylon]|uniref:Protection of telomeres protein 1 n=1 Tax=Xylaria hypoxylon TaxID=37992 RepID=A0A4Z0ZBJ6_9PEZI|nr:hypothetical protein E0Z10_g2748 [Xylaria hypoxylon]